MGYRAIRNALIAAGLALAATGALAEGMASPAMLSNTCAGCHGPNGNSQGPATPSIAGVSRGYFIAAMLSYKYDGDEEAIEAVVEANPSVLDADIFEAFARSGTIMGRIAKGYTDQEIFAMAEVFPNRPFVGNTQTTDPTLVAQGREIHENACEKCHEDGGTTSIDDVGILAGRWMPYLSNSIADFRNDKREMPKKMASKMKDLDDGDFKALIHYYGSHTR